MGYARARRKNFDMTFIRGRRMKIVSDGVVPRLARPDSNNLLKRHLKYLAVADCACLCSVFDRGDNLSAILIASGNFDFEFGEEIHLIFAAAIKLSVPFLSSEPLDLAHGHSIKADFIKGIFNVIKFKRFDYSHNQLHKKDILRFGIFF